MNIVIFMILIVVAPIVIIVAMSKFIDPQGKGRLHEILVAASILGAIFLAFWAPRIYVITEVDGEMTYSTNIYFFSSTYETESGESIEIEPVGFGCGVLNLTESSLQLYAVQYGDDYKSGKKSYFIQPKSYVATEEWNVDVFPPDHAPDEVRSKSSNTTYYVLSVYE